MITLAAEFPNDNPCLHRGACWVCETTTGPAIAVQPPPPVTDARPEPFPAEVAVEVPAPRESGVVRAVEERPAESLDDLAAAIFDVVEDVEGEVVVEELEPVEEVVVEGEPLVVVAPVVEEPVAEVAPSLPPPPEDPFRVFVNTLVDAALAADAPAAAAWIVALLDGTVPEALSADVAALLAAGRILEGGALAPSFEKARVAWSAILRGTSEDFEACGSAMLDDFASDLLGRLLGDVAKAPALRRDLRSRGIAAFGLLAA